MSKWNDLFEESPPPHHLQKMLKAAEPYLAQSLQKHRRSFMVKWLIGGLATGLATLAGVTLYQRRQNEGLQLAQFVDLEENDIEFVADQDFDLEMLENLELLIEEEEV